MGILLFVIYIIFLVYFLFFSEEYGRAAEAQRVYRYNLIPFVEIRRFWIYREQLGTFAVFSNIFGNVIGFLPFRFILPVIFRRMNSGFLICVSGFILSLTVEVIQLVTKVGCFDVDDMILNTHKGATGMFFLVTVHVTSASVFEQVSSAIIFEGKSWIAAMNEPCLPKRIYGYCMAAADFHILTCLRGQTCPFRRKFHYGKKI